MAKITSPTGLMVGTNLTVDTVGKIITLNAGGSLVAKDGVTMQALYSKLIDLWTTATYNKYPFPMYTIDSRSGQFQVGTDGSTYNGWKFSVVDTEATRNMIRDAGWTEYSAAGVVDRVYVGIVALASGFPAGTTQMYYQTSATGAANNFTFTDAPNQGIIVTASAGSGVAGAPFDYTTNNYFKIFCREYNYTYADSILSAVGETKTGPYKISLPVAVSSDLNVTDVDGTVASGAPYTSIGVKFFSSPFNKDVDTTTNRSYGIVVDVGTHSGIDGSNTAGGSILTTAAAGIIGADYIGGTLKIHSGSNKGTYTISGTPAAGSVTISGTIPNVGSGQSFTLYRASPVTATLKQIYTKVQYLLRQNSDIDNTGATVTGKTASSLMYFVGPTLVTGNGSSNANGGGSGVMVEGIQSSDVNSIELYDNTVTKRTYPYAAAGTISFNSFLIGAGSYYKMYYTDLTGVNDYGLVGAVTVNNASAAAIQGTIGSASIEFTYDYDGDTAGGLRSVSTPTAVTVVAGRPGYAKPVVATGTLSASKTISISLTAENDRAYTV